MVPSGSPIPHARAEDQVMPRCCCRASSCVPLVIILVGAAGWLVLLGGPADSHKVEPAAAAPVHARAA